MIVWVRFVEKDILTETKQQRRQITNFAVFIVYTQMKKSQPFSVIFVLCGANFEQCVVLFLLIVKSGN